MTSIYKIIYVGNEFVGKSALCNRIGKDYFDPNYLTTIGADLVYKTIKRDEHIYKLQHWDLSGAKRFRSIIATYYKIANAIVLVYDLMDPESFYDLHIWLDDLYNHFDFDDENAPFIFLLGNKSDLTEEMDRPIKKDVINNFINKYSIVKHIECSAKTNYNIEEYIDTLLNELIERTEKKDPHFKLSEHSRSNSVMSYEEMSYEDIDVKERIKDKYYRNCCVMI